APEGQRRVDLVLDPDERVEDHRAAIVAVDVIGVDARVVAVVRVPAIDPEALRAMPDNGLRPGPAFGHLRVLGEGELGHRGPIVRRMGRKGGERESARNRRSRALLARARSWSAPMPEA